MKKSEFYKKLINDSITVLKCPVCGEGFIKIDSMALKCRLGHSYDISSKGYINFFGGQATEYYTKGLFEARRKTVEMGFFKPVFDFIVNVMTERKIGVNCVLLDAGCGEGSALNYLIRVLENNIKTDGLKGIGVDISKEGISAATSFMNAMWFVSDIAGLPIINNTVDFLINILSPANYNEFARVVKKSGYVIKVIPGDDYLKELRESIHDDERESKHSDRRVIEHFKSKFGSDSVYEYDLKYDFKLPHDLEDGVVSQNSALQNIIEMTPLCRNLGAIAGERYSIEVPESICVHVKLLVAGR